MNIRLLGSLIVALEVIILVGITVHAPLTVWIGTFFPNDELVKSWKEILMGGIFLLLIGYLTATKKWHELASDWVIRVSAAYAMVHLLLMAWQPQGVSAAGAGILIDLRYILFMVMVYVTVSYVQKARRPLLIAAFTGAIIVIGFAALQLTILPDDILARIGYSKQTIAPYLTVDLNDQYVRINSTLRGPNPVGAYAGMCLAIIVAFVAQRRQSLSRNQAIVSGVLAIGSIAALWASYSRSAVVAGVIMVAVVAVAASVKRVPKGWWIASSMVLLGLIGGIIAARDTAFIQNVVLHENPAGGSAEKSNEGHVDSLHDGLARMVKQPLGGGIGSTGSASLDGKSPLIIENQYLFIAHESGWLGLAGFIALSALVLTRLWRARSDWLALGVFASGIGLAIIGLLLPVWVDDTVSIIWWGLAGLAMGSATAVTKRRNHAKNRTSNKKAA